MYMLNSNNVKYKTAKKYLRRFFILKKILHPTPHTILNL